MIVNIIVIIPYISLLLCYKPIRDKLKREEVISHCLITDFLRLILIGDILQLPWIHFNSLNTYFLYFKTVGDTVKCIWHGTHYLVAHFLHPEVIWNIRQ